MIYSQIGSGWQAGSGHGLKGTPRAARGLVRHAVCITSAPVLLILVLPKGEVS